MQRKWIALCWIVSAMSLLTASLAIADSVPATAPVWPWTDSSRNIEQGMYVDGYEPTVLPDVAAAEKLFRSMRPRTDFVGKFLWISGAQCYQRAQVWTYDMAQSGIKALKVVLWYSGWYYEWYRKEKTFSGNSAWVFHIAPAVQVGPEKEIYVLDRGFDVIKGPKKLQDWAHVFLDAPYVADCEIVKTARDYQARKNVTTAPCMMQIVPMYYYSPMFFDELENEGNVIRSFRGGDLDDAWKGLK